MSELEAKASESLSVTEPVMHIPSTMGEDSHGSLVRITEKIGRNEECPCGSGKKYKRCCL